VGGGVEVEENELRGERRRRHQAQDAIGQGQVPAAITMLPLHDRSSLTETARWMKSMAFFDRLCNHRSPQCPNYCHSVLQKVRILGALLRIEIQLHVKFLL
jgi:hypothetical protein